MEELKKRCDDAQEALTAAKDAQAAARQGKKAGRNSSAVSHAIKPKQQRKQHLMQQKHHQ